MTRIHNISDRNRTVDEDYNNESRWSEATSCEDGFALKPRRLCLLSPGAASVHCFVFFRLLCSLVCVCVFLALSACLSLCVCVCV